MIDAKKEKNTVTAAVTHQTSGQSSIQAKIAALKAHTAELKKQTQSSNDLLSKIKKMRSSPTPEQKSQQMKL